MDFQIGSINARGLGDRIKRREFFNWLRKKQLAVYFIQEAHCTENNMHDWRAEWGYQALFSCCSSRKAGVMILFNNNITFQILRTYCDPEGRFIICDMTTNGKQVTLVNLYAPNDDDWEMIKMKTREASINYGKTKKRNLEQKQDEIEKSIKSSRNKLPTHTRMTPKNYGQN